MPKISSRIIALIIFVGATVLTLIAPPGVSSQESGVGLGVVIGEPTGISGKFWLDGRSALDAAAAWSLGSETDFHLHASYLRHAGIKGEDFTLPVHYGVGGRLKAGKKDRLGIRGVVGISFYLTRVPMDIFFEIAPIVDLISSTGFDLNAGIGARYYF